MRIVTPTALRELAAAMRKKIPAMSQLTDLLELCAKEIESRDAQIEGLTLALKAKKDAATS